MYKAPIIIGFAAIVAMASVPALAQSNGGMAGTQMPPASTNGGMSGNTMPGGAASDGSMSGNAMSGGAMSNGSADAMSSTGSTSKKPMHHKKMDHKKAMSGTSSDGGMTPKN